MSPALVGGFFTTEPPGKPPKFLFIWLGWISVAASGIWFSDQGLNSGPMDWELGVLAAGPRGKSQTSVLTLQSEAGTGVCGD